MRAGAPPQSGATSDVGCGACGEARDAKRVACVSHENFTRTAEPLPFRAEVSKRMFAERSEEQALTKITRSCSVYMIEAIERFGAMRGAILSAWRLMRCNPTGGRGLDEPTWPPVSYRAGRWDDL